MSDASLERQVIVISIHEDLSGRFVAESASAPDFPHFASAAEGSSPEDAINTLLGYLHAPVEEPVSMSDFSRLLP